MNKGPYWEKRFLKFYYFYLIDFFNAKAVIFIQCLRDLPAVTVKNRRMRLHGPHGDHAQFRADFMDKWTGEVYWRNEFYAKHVNTALRMWGKIMMEMRK